MSGKEARMVVLLFCENDNRCNGKAKLPPGYRQPAYLVGSMIPLASITACKPCRQPGAFQFLFLSNLPYKCHSSVRFFSDRACSLVGRLWGPSQNLRLTLLEAVADLLLWNLRCVYRIISIIIHLWKPFSFQFQLFKIFSRWWHVCFYHYFECTVMSLFPLQPWNISHATGCNTTPKHDRKCHNEFYWSIDHRSTWVVPEMQQACVDVISDADICSKDAGEIFWWLVYEGHKVGQCTKNSRVESSSRSS